MSSEAKNLEAISKAIDHHNSTCEWPAVAVALSIVGPYAAQSFSEDAEAAAKAFSLVPSDLWQGDWAGLFTCLFVHASWMHALLNALGALAFGAPVARLFGPRPLQVLGFFLFYFVCGAVSGIGFAAVHPGSHNFLIGASGAVSGLMGAASRLLDRRSGLAPFTSPTVVGMAAGWIVVNALLAVVGLNFGTGGAPIAWEAHLFGYAAGLALVGPTARLLGSA